MEAAGVFHLYFLPQSGTVYFAITAEEEIPMGSAERLSVYRLGVNSVSSSDLHTGEKS